MSRIINFLKIESGDLIKPSVLVLILANLVPLYGVLFLDWQVFPILLVFWLENVIVGVFNVLKMIVSSSPKSDRQGSKLAVIPFFCMHYGIFTAVHGVFVFVLFGGLFGDIGTEGSANPVSARPADLNVGWAVLALLVSHAVSFGVNYIGKGEYKTISPSELMFQPYGRVVIMHITILAGGGLLAFIGTPLAGLIILVILKIFFDLVMHLRQHRKTGRAASKVDLMAGLNIQ